MTHEIISHELNFQALSVLQNSLSKKLYQRTMLSEASKGVWDVLDRMHEQLRDVKGKYDMFGMKIDESSEGLYLQLNQVVDGLQLLF